MLKLMIVLIVLFTPTIVCANMGQGTMFQGDLTPAEITFESLVGITGLVFIKLAAIVALAVAAFKNRLPAIFTGGWKTHVLTACVSFILCYTLMQDWRTIFTLTILLWLVPAGSISILKETWEGLNKGKLDVLNLKVNK